MANTTKKELTYSGWKSPSYTKNQLVWLALRLDAEDIGGRVQGDFTGLQRLAAHININGYADFGLYKDSKGKIYFKKGDTSHLPF